MHMHRASLALALALHLLRLDALEYLNHHRIIIAQALALTPAQHDNRNAHAPKRIQNRHIETPTAIGMTKVTCLWPKVFCSIAPLPCNISKAEPCMLTGTRAAVSGTAAVVKTHHMPTLGQQRSKCTLHLAKRKYKLKSFGMLTNGAATSETPVRMDTRGTACPAMVDAAEHNKHGGTHCAACLTRTHAAAVAMAHCLQVRRGWWQREQLPAQCGCSSGHTEVEQARHAMALCGVAEDAALAM